MSLVWRKIQRSSKKAAKFKFSANFQELSIHCSERWQPKKVCVSWVHRRRRYETREYRWEPTITDEMKGLIVWPNNTETLEMVTTLYRDTRTHEFDDKDWTFIVEEITAKGKHRPIASVSLNLRLFIHEMPGTQTEVKLKLRPLCQHVQHCIMQLVLASAVVKEGDALDDDMQSEASVISTAHHRSTTSSLDTHSRQHSQQHVTSGRDAQEAPTAVIEEDEDGQQSNWASREARVALAEMRSGIEQLASRSRQAVDEVEHNVVDVERKQPSKDGAGDASAAVPPPAPVHRTHEQPSISRPADNDSGLADTTDASLCATADDAASSSRSTQQPSSISAATTVMNTTTSTDDLLSWCQKSLAGYRGLRVNDFGRSWRSGMAFAALIHRYRPDVIEFAACQPPDIRGNCDRAFNAAALMGVPRILDVNDMVMMNVPDKIAVMTYVHALRAALTGTATTTTANATSSSSSTVVTDGAVARSAAAEQASNALLGLSEGDTQVFAELEKLKQQREQAAAFDLSTQDTAFDSALEASAVSTTLETSTTTMGVVKLTKSSSRHSLNQQQQQQQDGGQRERTEADALRALRGTPLMKRRQLANPFDDSDDDSSDDQQQRTTKKDTATVAKKPKKPADPPPATTFKRADISRESLKLASLSDLPTSAAGQKPQAAVSSSSSAGQQQDRQEQLKQRARQLLDEYKVGAGSTGNGSRPQRQASTDSQGEPPTCSSVEDEYAARQRELRQRARQMMTAVAGGSEQHSTQASTSRVASSSGAVIKLNSDGSFAAHENGDSSPTKDIRWWNWLKLRVDPALLGRAQSYRNSTGSNSRSLPRPQADSSNGNGDALLRRPLSRVNSLESNGLDRPLLPTFDLRTSTERLSSGGGMGTPKQARRSSAQHIAVANAQQQQLSASVDSPFDRLKRFGSMRKQDLTDTMNELSSRLSTTGAFVKSSSLPKALGDAEVLPGSSVPPVRRAAAGADATDNGSSGGTQPDEQQPPKTAAMLFRQPSVWESELRTPEQLAAAQDFVSSRMKELSNKAEAVERRLRIVTAQSTGSAEETALMNEYLALLNARNLLVGREQYLNVLQAIREHEQQFARTQQILGELLKVDDDMRSEAQKRQIDSLMQQLIEGVNKKDELSQQLIQCEQEAEEATELPDNLLAFPDYHEDKCSLM